MGNIYNLHLTIARYDQHSKKTEFDNKPVNGDKKKVYSRLDLVILRNNLHLITQKLEF